ncbi:hypothetical protein N665_0502s0045, partial [Sinapis alba]
FYKQTKNNITGGISKSKPYSRKDPPKHAATQVSDATQWAVLILHGPLDANGRYRLACVDDQHRRRSCPRLVLVSIGRI